LGSSGRGTPIEVNRALKEFDKVILTVRLAFTTSQAYRRAQIDLSGLAAAKRVEATHMLALDFERGGRREVLARAFAGNAVHEECERVCGIDRSHVFDQRDCGRPRAG